MNLRTIGLCVGAAVLVACGGPGVGKDADLLVGSWALQGEPDAGAPGIAIRDTVVSYAADGTSDYAARMVVDADGGDMSFQLDGDVRWTLEETVLTRTLERMQVQAESDSPAAAELAANYQQGLNASPPARFIVEELTEERLALLDPDTGSLLVFARVSR